MKLMLSLGHCNATFYATTTVTSARILYKNCTVLVKCSLCRENCHNLFNFLEIVLAINDFFKSHKFSTLKVDQ